MKPSEVVNIIYLNRWYFLTFTIDGNNIFFWVHRNLIDMVHISYACRPTFCWNFVSISVNIVSMYHNNNKILPHARGEFIKPRFISIKSIHAKKEIKRWEGFCASSSLMHYRPNFRTVNFLPLTIFLLAQILQQNFYISYIFEQGISNARDVEL